MLLKKKNRKQRFNSIHSLPTNVIQWGVCGQPIYRRNATPGTAMQGLVSMQTANAGHDYLLTGLSVGVALVPVRPLWSLKQ